ncbi:MAG TPA: pyridoxal-phosphate dependent enzyme [Tepidisphaeraceae bacterium]|nr:pyridoxal-phosphate dependent enzyme [Tepidisphaeraceae bacterium]
MSIWRFADRFSTTPAGSRVTLGEGNTPLVRSRRLGPSVGAERLYFKLESANPTGSYKDRFAAAAVSDMLARGHRRCIATSSGNTGSALAAYCAAAGIGCEIAVVETAPPEKLKQMMAYGARIHKVRGFGTDAQITADVFARIRERGSRPGAALQISAFACSPIGMAGVQTISYELAEQVEGPIDHLFVPAGGGGLTLAVARGCQGKTMPRIQCVQPAGNATIAGPLREGIDRAGEVECTTKISGLQVPSVLDGDDVIAACRASGGTGHLVRDEDVWDVQARLAREEGIFCEPAGAVSVAAALMAIGAGEVARDAIVCCIVTGTGFKDVPSVDRMLCNSSCPTIALDEMSTE